MLKILTSRIRQGHRTIAYPEGEAVLPDRFRGRPTVDAAKCAGQCDACVPACPTQAVGRQNGKLGLDMGKCLFCGECAAACPTGAVSFTREHSMAARSRNDLVLTDAVHKAASALEEKSRRIFGRSLKLRQVCAGGCGACEADLNVLSTVVFDLSRFGIQFVASPRHADGIVVTGPVTTNVRLALLKTYEAVPAPKLVIAVGACAISGGPYAGHAECCDGASTCVPVDLFVPGCPPHPLTILDGLLRLIGRVGSSPAAR